MIGVSLIRWQIGMLEENMEEEARIRKEMEESKRESVTN